MYQGDSLRVKGNMPFPFLRVYLVSAELLHRILLPLSAPFSWLHTEDVSTIGIMTI